jgi:hypothetical protein
MLKGTRGSHAGRGILMRSFVLAVVEHALVDDLGTPGCLGGNPTDVVPGNGDAREFLLGSVLTDSRAPLRRRRLRFPFHS